MKNAGKKDLIKDIIKYSIELRLPAIRKYLEDDLEDATKNNLSYGSFSCTRAACQNYVLAIFNKVQSF